MLATPDDLAVRLQRATLPGLAGRVSLPTYDARELRPGVLHVGLGRFHRAHQERYVDDLAETGASSRWGIVGAGMRSRGSCSGLAALLPPDRRFSAVLGITAFVPRAERAARATALQAAGAVAVVEGWDELAELLSPTTEERKSA